jgi:hypothetical protein
MRNADRHRVFHSAAAAAAENTETNLHYEVLKCMPSIRELFYSFLPGISVTKNIE